MKSRLLGGNRCTSRGETATMTGKLPNLQSFPGLLQTMFQGVRNSAISDSISLLRFQTRRYNVKPLREVKERRDQRHRNAKRHCQRVPLDLDLSELQRPWRVVNIHAKNPVVPALAEQAKAFRQEILQLA